MLRELIGFMPWILFAYLASKDYMLAVEVALVGSIIISLPEIFARRIKVFTIGTFIFFAALIFIASQPGLVKLEHWTSPASYGMLFLISLVSILIKKPFTLQYAMEQVPEEYWNSPLFIKINYHLTIAWTIGFFIDTVAATIVLDFPQFHSMAFKWIPTVILVILIYGNSWYPDYAKKKYIPPEALEE